MAHTHTDARMVSERVFTAPVAWPARDQNPAAHGGVEQTWSCSCGAQRKVLINGAHREDGPWGPSQAERQAAVQDQLAKLTEEWVQEVEGGKPVRIRVQPAGDGMVRVSLDGEAQVYDVDRIHIDPRCTEGVKASWEAIKKRARQILDVQRQAA